ncbi:MAG: methyl-accepting chemotaxis protein [Bacteriovoracaceae bacterium]|nr:methyl-accepting chemotaxis protein [Bacteriovoracaceae bacterium]
MKNFSLKSKILTLSLFLISISILIGIVSFFYMDKIIKEYSVIPEVSYPNTTNMLQMFSNYQMARIEGQVLASPSETDEHKLKAIELMNKIILNDKSLQKRYQEVEHLPGEKDYYESFRKNIDESYINLNKVVELYKKSKTDSSVFVEINTLMSEKIWDSGNKAQMAMEKLRDFHLIETANATKIANRDGSTSKIVIISLIVILGSIGFFVAIFLTNMLVKSLRDVTESLAISSSDVSSATTQIAASAEDLSQATTEQAASLQETSASVEELSSMVSVNSENAKKASDNSTMSQKHAERGREVVTQMVQSMSEINESNNNIMEHINHSNEQLGEIVKVIQEIGNKTKVINDIVFQTKLLSFNASVEAARAGEQGKGFAVVAEEVGNLAQMSGNAAKEISDMLSASVSKVETIVEETKSKVDQLMSVGKSKVDTGSKIAQECGEVLAEIVLNVSSVTSMASEISNASTEQSKGIIEINKAMGQLDQVTQSNTLTSQQSANSAEQLAIQANSLKAQVATLVKVINGGTDNKQVDSKVIKKNIKQTALQVTPVKTEVKIEPVKVVSPSKKSFDIKNSSDLSNILPIKKKILPEPEVKKAVHKTEDKKIINHSTQARPKLKDGVPSHDHPGFEDV